MIAVVAGGSRRKSKSGKKRGLGTPRQKPVRNVSRVHSLFDFLAARALQSV
jgi:hypothetical protein